MGERCTFRDDDDCSFTFSYKENPGKDIEIFVQREKGNTSTLSTISSMLVVVITTADGAICNTTQLGLSSP